ncbi:MAG TPA: glycoside hydrolase family 15 protein [Chlorobaculum sp.]|uniref:Uncharacterized protein n=1 Tax=Chlorobaculum tepidum (strain ATCC 49652 / DSM 12025 / NBRC 103806 / TLS) TaxID=194439 RepID=Q8KCQ4_CHLTE|nr:glycoside hydrolase family 15 protein [Chlorobaculum tepidum]AAM72588.1 conserved hypothetical protein [Chlorobaculum tepidum TLS]HBU24554.1 glycoside hydrolase family 15 protein [Chlorobaculum sp.]
MYPNISDCGVIGDTRTAALVNSNGSIDYCSLPYFDSPTVFAALLDERKGGYFSLKPAEAFSSRREYLPDTCILCTSFTTRNGKAALYDFMPHQDDKTRERTQGIHRCIRVDEGRVKFTLTLKLLTFQQTGAIVAAATTSLPESIGGKRNWDYRFTWIRNASFTLKAFFALSHTSEADTFIRWLHDTYRKNGSRGFSQKLNAFVQRFDTEILDASLLIMPLVDFLPVTDQRIQGTIEACQTHLMDNGFIRRYRADDGLEEDEGGFLLCNFWMIECLALSGKSAEAEKLLGITMAAANDLGLFSEEYDPYSREMLGNFPQAFSHIGYINAAATLIDSKLPLANP